MELINTDNDIYIETLITKINNLGNESNKTEFIENYNNVKEEINKIDDIINKVPEIDNALDIQDLFKMLNEYTDIINQDNIKLKDYKNIMDLVTLIDNKLNNEKKVVHFIE